MNVIKQELVLREYMHGIEIVEKQYIKILNGEAIQENYIAYYSDCVIAKSNNTMWSVIYVNAHNSSEFENVKEDSRFLNYPELYEKYNDLKLRSISAFHEVRVIVERESD